MAEPTRPPINVAKLKRKRRTDPLESTVESKVCEYAESLGIMQYKFSSPGRRSVPDRIFLCMAGDYPAESPVFFIEFKRRGKQPTPGQLREHARLRAQGYDVYVVDNEIQGKKIIDSYA